MFGGVPVVIDHHKPVAQQRRGLLRLAAVLDFAGLLMPPAQQRQAHEGLAPLAQPGTVGLNGAVVHLHEVLHQRSAGPG